MLLHPTFFFSLWLDLQVEVPSPECSGSKPEEDDDGGTTRTPGEESLVPGSYTGWDTRQEPVKTHPSITDVPDKTLRPSTVEDVPGPPGGCSDP